MNRRAVVLAGVAAGLVGAAFVACFSERGTGPSGNQSGECSVPVSVIDSKHYIVAIRSFGFHPASITVPVGATVTWVNCETPPQEPHTTTANGGAWSSPDLNPGDRFSHTFPASGAFPYHCTPHPFMLGEVDVQ